MDLEDVITVTKLYIQGQRSYLMIGWQTDSFEMCLYYKGDLWKGKCTPSRLAGFSRNLQMSDKDYFKKIKQSLTQAQNDYIYEVKSGFFYWKRKLKDSVMIEGFLPIEIDSSSKNAQPDLVEVLLALNKHLKGKNAMIKKKLNAIKSEYQKCLKDTGEFLDLKMEMEKSLCEKFLSLISLQKSRNKCLDDPDTFIKELENENPS